MNSKVFRFKKSFYFEVIGTKTMVSSKSVRSQFSFCQLQVVEKVKDIILLDYTFTIFIWKFYKTISDIGFLFIYFIVKHLVIRKL